MQTNFTEEQLKLKDNKSSEKIFKKCVHCGMCNATCPTFNLLGDELDGPRGRIYLIQDMLENEKKVIWDRFEQDRKAGIIDDIDKGKKDSVLKKEYSEIAERRVRLGLLMAEIGDVNKITVTDDEIKTAVMQEARKYPGEENKVIEFYQKNPEAANAVRAPLFEEKVVDHIISKCSIKDIKVTSEKLYEDNVIADPTAKSKNKTKSKTTKTSKSVKAKPKK